MGAEIQKKKKKKKTLLPVLSVDALALRGDEGRATLR
jgi:hypothetical protein